MTKKELWKEYKSKVSNCSFRNGKICDICEKKFEDNEYCMCSALNYGCLEHVIFECEKCFFNDEPLKCDNCDCEIDKESVLCFDCLERSNNEK